MQPALVGEPQRPAGPDAGYGRVVDPFDIDADLKAGLVFLFELGAMTFLRREKEAVHASKIGIDPFVPADRLDAVHGSDLAVVIKTRLVLAPNPGQLRIEIVEFGCEVCGCSRRHSATDAAAIDYDYRAAEPVAE